MGIIGDTYDSYRGLLSGEVSPQGPQWSMLERSILWLIFFFCVMPVCMELAPCLFHLYLQYIFLNRSFHRSAL